MKISLLLCVFFLIITLKSWSQSEPIMDEVAPSKDWHKNVKTGPFQEIINQYQAGKVIKLSPGIYHGPIYINRSDITIIAEKGAIIEGHGVGSVIVIEGNNIKISGLTIKGSGLSYTDIDSGISVRSSSNVVLENNIISDCLFGIDVYSSQKVNVEKNIITSKNLDLSIRGDAIRFWSSSDSVVRNNKWSDSRDTVAWYSNNIIFEKNEASDSRYSIHSMYSHHLKIVGNHFKRNSVGIFLMYGSDVVISDNHIEHSLGATGKGIGLKEVSNIIIQKNKIFYSSIGLSVDNSPFNLNSKNWYLKNTIAFNTNGVVLTNDRPGGEFKENNFAGNLSDVESNNRFGSKGKWINNYWDKYDGFDKNNDGVGDTSYIVKKYEDTLRDSSPNTSFFYGSPIVSLISLIEEVTSFSAPLVVLRDEMPMLIKK